MRGTTLIELVVTIVVIGILAGIGALILVPAFEAYFATQRRAEMADVADTALRRVVRDVRLALPNSARTATDVSGNQFLEILLTKNGGRYRSINDDDTPSATTEDPLRFDAADTIFDTLGTLPTAGEQQVQANDYVVIHNLGIPGANAYDLAAASRNIAQISAFGAGALAGEDRITLGAATQFALESPGRRFFVVSGPVAYACMGGQLLRWSGYAITLTHGAVGTNEPPKSRPAGATEALLANNVSNCEFSYTNVAHLSRGLVGVRVTLARNNEPVTLYYEAQINNVP